MNTTRAFTGAEIFDGHRRHQDCALLVRGGVVVDIIGSGDLPQGCEVIALDGGLIAPGLVDLQVNGGGGVMLNNAPDLETIEQICAAHIKAGTTSLMPTLITDTPERTAQALAGGTQAAARGVPGFIGMHLEGPHLSAQRKGAHDPDMIRKMTANDLDRLFQARASLPDLLVTLAPESASIAQIQALSGAGIVVSLGHSDAGFTTVRDAAQAGATCVTHLFNAMSQLTGREPGMVGAALADGTLFAGLIADGIHVDGATIQVALHAKQGPAKIFLVSDAMATIGSNIEEFTLNGRKILRKNGRLTLADGTLAGADIDLMSAVRYLANTLGVDLDEALRMASLYPAQLLKRSGNFGVLTAGAVADFIHIDEEAVDLRGVWVSADRVAGS